MPEANELRLFPLGYAVRPTPSKSQERRNGRYAREKLDFLNRFLPPALKATRRKITRHYVDLFAGPGRFRDEGGVLHDGSPLRALGVGGSETGGVSFTDATLVNLLEPHQEALKTSIAEAHSQGRLAVPLENVQFVDGDANAMLPSILASIHRKSYVFVFADPESPNQLPWTSIESLRSQGHESIDLYLLFPLHMGIVRMLAYDQARLEPNTAALNRFFGTDAWRDVVLRRRTDNDRERLVVELEELYVGRLRELGWHHAGRVREIRRRGKHRLYRMLFATNHPVAAALVEWETRSAQMDLLG